MQYSNLLFVDGSCKIQLLGEVQEGKRSIRVCEQVNLAALALYSQIMAELALEALSALPCSEVLTDNGLGINACSDEAAH